MWCRCKNFGRNFSRTYAVSFSSVEEYFNCRNILIHDNYKLSVGADIQLTKNESKVNAILMRYKLAECNKGFTNPESYLAAQHFFKAKSAIEECNVFKILLKLPKGALLHSHDLALCSQEYLLKLTYKENLYFCESDNGFRFHFFDKNRVDKTCNWSLVTEARDCNPKFDEYLKSKFSLEVDDPCNTYPTVNSVWVAFVNCFNTVINLMTYKPIWREYFYQALKELHEDKVTYLEFRTILPQLYDLEGNTYDECEVVNIYYEVLQKFKFDYPDFIGAKLIYAPHRLVDKTTLDNYVNIFLRIREAFPDFVVGFDLVGQEDLGYPLDLFVSQLLHLKSLGVKFFFHAGETNWYGTTTDMNLFDAVLLNTTRIGHGYAILKHPVIAQKVKDQKIAIEISPISNQVLKLVDDVRNHPGAVMIANDFPVVITNDDPTFWGAKALSYDWYYAFMAMASREADLRFLKQLAMNSLLYSSMNATEKDLALSQWRNDWEEFIHNLLIEHNQV